MNKSVACIRSVKMQVKLCLTKVCPIHSVESPTVSVNKSVPCRRSFG
jgi:hypothetical protein